MDYKLIIGAVFFIILITIQYSLNRIVSLLREIKEILRQLAMKEKL